MINHAGDQAITVEQEVMVLKNCMDELGLRGITIHSDNYMDVFKQLITKIIKTAEQQNKPYLIEQLQFAGLIY